jgi:hypothetical protein
MLRLALPVGLLLACCGVLPAPAPTPTPVAAPTPVRGIKWHYTADIGKIEAAADGKTVLFTGLDAAMYYSVEEEADFDGDGTLDAVIGISTGGNCCPTGYYFATVRPAGTPFLSVEFASSFDLPSREGSVVVVKSEEKVGRYRFDGTRGVDAGSTAIEELPAVVELRGVAPFQGGAPRLLEADLDGDGSLEQVVCEIWERWGSLLCKVPLKNGIWESPGCDRFGVLSTKSQGYSDLVCNRNIVFRFDGQIYQEVVK